MTKSSTKISNTARQYSDLTTEELKQLTQGIMACLDAWELTPQEIVSILDLANQVKARQLQSFRQGDQAFPESKQLITRIDHLIGIADALRTTYPFSEQMQLMWLRKPHRRFQRQSPLAVMLEDETPNGLLKVRMEVDCNYGYAISEALRNQQH